MVQAAWCFIMLGCWQVYLLVCDKDHLLYCWVLWAVLFPCFSFNNYQSLLVFFFFLGGGFERSYFNLF